MFIILVYDVNTKRVARVLKTSRKYLHWVQNSVLEGELSSAQLFKFKTELKKILNEKEDSVIFYKFRTKTYYDFETLGLKKGGEERIL